MSILGFAVVIGSGTARAAPQNCTVTLDLFGTTAGCHDVDMPVGTEYALIVECFGLHAVPNAFPILAIGPYQGSWSGPFPPSGQGAATCLGPTSIGPATNAYVTIYRD